MDNGVTERLSQIRLIVCDVDGTLTDGKLTYDSMGYESKSFHVHDGFGIALAHQCGISIAFMTGRTSPVVQTRAKELGVKHALQGIKNKADGLVRLSKMMHIPFGQMAMIGDDWNDLPAMQLAGLSFAVGNAVEEVRTFADVVLTRPGGYGGVREAIMMIIAAQKGTQSTLDLYLASIKSQDLPPAPQ